MKFTRTIKLHTDEPTNRFARAVDIDSTKITPEELNKALGILPQTESGSHYFLPIEVNGETIFSEVAAEAFEQRFVHLFECKERS